MPNFQSVISKYVSQHAVAYCVALQERFQFDFAVTRARKSKWGDFRGDQYGRCRVSVNGNLNQYNFLITYLHEVAHCAVFRQYDIGKVAPHGKEWKRIFSELLSPVLHESIFPEGRLPYVKKFALNPKASVNASYDLVRVLSDDNIDSQQTLLKDIKREEVFTFRSRVFRKLEVKRTRSLCLEIRTNKKYLVSEFAEVEPLRN